MCVCVCVCVRARVCVRVRVLGVLLAKKYIVVVPSLHRERDRTDEVALLTAGSDAAISSIISHNCDPFVKASSPGYMASIAAAFVACGIV